MPSLSARSLQTQPSEVLPDLSLPPSFVIPSFVEPRVLTCAVPVLPRWRGSPSSPLAPLAGPSVSSAGADTLANEPVPSPSPWIPTLPQHAGHFSLALPGPSLSAGLSDSPVMLLDAVSDGDAHQPMPCPGWPSPHWFFSRWRCHPVGFHFSFSFFIFFPCRRRP